MLAEKETIYKLMALLEEGYRLRKGLWLGSGESLFKVGKWLYYEVSSVWVPVIEPFRTFYEIT